MKILNFSSHYEDCGIAKYQENYKDELNDRDIVSDFFEYSPYQTRDMNSGQFAEVVKKLKQKLNDYDILHIQHEFGFFRGNQLVDIVKTAKQLGKKVVITYHTSPDLIIIKKPLTGLGPHSLISFARSYKHNASLQKSHIYPLQIADLVIAHNQYTFEQLVNYGVERSSIVLIPHPTYPITKPKKSTFIAEKLAKKDGDIILSTIGYIHRFKGMDKAIKALSFLPSNYKLAILGGVKSDSDDQSLYDKLSDLIIARGLQDRVYITGVIESDEDLNSYIRETDISLYPYDSKYYKGVSSGALNLAIANERPIVAYPVDTLKETSSEHGQLVFTQSDSYYELAKEIANIDVKKQTKLIQKYAKVNSWNSLTDQLLEAYRRLSS